MRKNLPVIVLLVVLLCCSFPVSAFAAGDASGETQISVTFSGLGDGMDSPDVTGPTSTGGNYEINIPGSYSTNNEPCMSITANFVSLEPGTKLVVSVDGEKTYCDGQRLPLIHETNKSSKVYCDLYRSNTYGVIGEWMPPGNEVVAVFEDGNTTPTEYGYIVASASAGDDTIDGTYTGTVYFKIAVEPT